MTRSRFRLTPWPFEKGEAATLLWLSSPQMKGPQNQWRSSALFRSDRGKVKDVEFDWAMLPLLRIGQQFKDGAPQARRMASGSQVDLSRAGEPELVRARAVLSREVYRLYKLEYWQEHCWVWTLPGSAKNRVVLPVLVLIQGLFARGSTVTVGLLDQLFLDSFRHEIEGSKLKLTFNAAFELPKKKRARGSLLTLIARLLCDSSFGLAFRSVALGLAANPAAPLSCELPELHPIWKARVLSRGNIRLIQELLRAEPLNPLSVKRVAYDHPLFPRRTEPKPEVRTVHDVNVPDGYEVDTEPQAARIPRTKDRLPAPAEPLVECTRLTVENAGQEEEGLGKTIVLPSKGGDERKVSLAETGRSATVPQAGVSPGSASDAAEQPDELEQAVEAWARSCKDGLDDFRLMLWELKASYDVDVQFRLGPKTLHSKKGVTEIPRRYATVLLSSPEFAPVWLIEFTRRRSRNLSTLAVSGCSADWAEFKEMLAAILTNGLNPSYWWDLEGLDLVRDATGFDILRIPHVTREAKAWAARMYEQLR